MTRKTIIIKVPTETHRAVKMAAASKGQTINRILSTLLTHKYAAYRVANICVGA
jgi:predicted HicB family RNase H-like nuclease